jgi:hypothetical protein
MFLGTLGFCVLIAAGFGGFGTGGEQLGFE